LEVRNWKRKLTTAGTEEPQKFNEYGPRFQRLR
jgi:hypothetical protein